MIKRNKPRKKMTAIPIPAMSAMMAQWPGSVFKRVSIPDMQRGCHRVWCPFLDYRMYKIGAKTVTKMAVVVHIQDEQIGLLANFD